MEEQIGKTLARLETKMEAVNLLSKRLIELSIEREKDRNKEYILYISMNIILVAAFVVTWYFLI